MLYEPIIAKTTYQNSKTNRQIQKKNIILSGQITLVLTIKNLPK